MYVHTEYTHTYVRIATIWKGKTVWAIPRAMPTVVANWMMCLIEKFVRCPAPPWSGEKYDAQRGWNWERWKINSYTINSRLNDTNWHHWSTWEKIRSTKFVVLLDRDSLVRTWKSMSHGNCSLSALPNCLSVCLCVDVEIESPALTHSLAVSSILFTSHERAFPVLLAKTGVLNSCSRSA